VLVVSSAFSPGQVSLTSVVGFAQKNSINVRLAQADVQKAASLLSQSRDAFVPSISFGSGLPAFPGIGFTGSLPTIWDSNLQSMVFSMPQIRYIQAARAGLQAAQLALKDANEQVALDSSAAYIEMDTVNSELEAVHEQEHDAARLVAIEQQRTEAGVDPFSNLLQAQLTTAQLKLTRLHFETRAATLAKQLATLSGLPVGSITPDHSSIPEVPAITADQAPISTAALGSAQAQA
jgi:outer membrane protein TolC